jgi:hypothetical protein
MLDQELRDVFSCNGTVARVKVGRYKLGDEYCTFSPLPAQTDGGWYGLQTTARGTFTKLCIWDGHSLVRPVYESLEQAISSKETGRVEFKSRKVQNSYIIDKDVVII